MSDVVFPNFPGLTWDIPMKPMHNIKKAISTSGNSIRGRYGAYPIWELSNSFEFLRSDKTLGSQGSSGGFLTTGMVSSWSFDSDVTDSEGVNNGTPTAITYNTSTQKLGTASAIFDGATSRVELPTDIPEMKSNQAFSLGMWIKSSDTGTSIALQNIKGVVIGTGDAVNAHVHFGINGGNAVIEWWDGSDHFTQGSAIVCDGTFHSVVFTCDGAGNISIYVDGVFDVGGTFTYAQTSANTKMGTLWNATGSSWFNGETDEMGLWSRVLTGTEITAFHNGGAGKVIGSATVITPKGTELAEFMGFFNARHGSFDSFLYDNQEDNTATAQVFGTGDAVETVFQLTRTLGSTYGFTEPTQNINTITNIYFDDVIESPANYSVDTLGVVTFNTPPGAGVVITWTGTFYYRVTFLEDMANFNLFMHKLWNLDVISFKGSPTNKML